MRRASPCDEEPAPAPTRTADQEDTMKQIAQNYKSGELTVLDVPAPYVGPAGY